MPFAFLAIAAVALFAFAKGRSASPPVVSHPVVVDLSKGPAAQTTSVKKGEAMTVILPAEPSIESDYGFLQQFTQSGACELSADKKTRRCVFIAKAVGSGQINLFIQGTQTVKFTILYSVT